MSESFENFVDAVFLQVLTFRQVEGRTVSALGTHKKLLNPADNGGSAAERRLPLSIKIESQIFHFLKLFNSVQVELKTPNTSAP